MDIRIRKYPVPENHKFPVYLNCQQIYILLPYPQRVSFVKVCHNKKYKLLEKDIKIDSIFLKNVFIVGVEQKIYCQVSSNITVVENKHTWQWMNSTELSGTII